MRVFALAVLGILTGILLGMSMDQQDQLDKLKRQLQTLDSSCKPCDCSKCKGCPCQPKKGPMVQPFAPPAPCWVCADTCTWPSRPAPGWTTSCRVVSVHDGDTLTVEVSRRLQVRLLDCWAPELRDEGGPESGQHLRRLADGKKATLHIPAAKNGEEWRLLTFGRVLGHVWLEGDECSLSEHQVKAGKATKTKAGQAHSAHP